jgi:DNA ligase-1
MPDIEDGDSVEVPGSGSNVYTLKNVGGVYSCTCPAWSYQSLPIEQRTCKHLRRYRGEEAEKARLGDAAVAPPPRKRTTPSGEEAEAPPILLAERWDSFQDPKGWWMSEKLDGVRAYWDGKQFVSRQGNVYMAPDWFIEGLPSDMILDGELWIGRRKFQSTVSVVRRADKSDHWKKVRYLVFDAPEVDGPFEDRLVEVERVLEGHAYAAAHPHEVCEGLDHMKQELARVESLGGEGLMLRKPRSRYVNGRSSTLLKVKTFHDAEARVIGHLPGSGRHKGRLGALQVTLPDGTLFSVGTGFSDAEREDPPAVGEIITFRYQELSNGGVPRFPSYVGVRADAEWPPRSPDQPGAINPAKKAAPARPKPRAETPPPKPKPKPAPAAPAVASTSDAPKRRLELRSRDPGKFWEVEQQGKELYIRFGRLGCPGQTRLKTFDTEAEAASQASKLAAQKQRKGYEEVER